MKETRTLFFALALAGFVVSCGGGDDAPESTTTLTDNEAEAVAAVLGEQTGVAFESSVGSDSKLSIRFQTTGSQSVSLTESCPQGGTSTAEGTVDVTSASSSDVASNFDLTATFTDCGEQTGEGKTLIMNGSVGLTGNIDMAFTFTGSEISSVTGTASSDANGSVDVSGDSITSGTCGIDMKGNSVLSGSTIATTFSGSLCGTTVAFSETESIE